MRNVLAPTLLGALLLASCSSTATTRPPVPTGGPLILPAGEDSYLLFREGAMELHVGGESQNTTLQPTMGKPAAAGVDAQNLWAAIAFDKTFATFQLIQPDPEWKVAPWATPPNAVSVFGQRAAVTAGTHVFVYDAEDPERPIWERELQPWLDKTGMDQLHYAVSTSAEELFLVGYDGGFGGGNALLMRVPLAEGGENIQEWPIQQLSVLNACTSDGSAIYVAGVRNQLQRGTNLDNSRQLATLLVYRFDPATQRTETVLDLQNHDQTLEVTDLSVGPEALALVFNETRLEVYSPSGNRLHQENFSTPISVAWTSLDQIAVSGDGEPKLLSIR